MAPPSSNLPLIHIVTLEDLNASGGQSLRLRRLLPELARHVRMVLVGRGGPLPGELQELFDSRIELPLASRSPGLAALRGWRGPWRLARIARALRQLPPFDAVVYTDSALLAALLAQPPAAPRRRRLVIEVNGIIAAEQAHAGGMTRRDIKRDFYAPPTAYPSWSPQNRSLRARAMARIVARFERRGLRAADRLIAVSEGVASAAARIIAGLQFDEDDLPQREKERVMQIRSRIPVIGNGVDISRFNPAVDGSSIRSTQRWESAPVGIMISSFRPWHGVENLIDAMPAILKARPDFKLVLPGDGPGRAAAMAHARLLHVDAAVEFPGAIAPEVIPQWLAAADVALYYPQPLGGANEFLGDPIKLTEYMAMGRPIVAARRGKLAADIENLNCGLVTRPEPLEFAAAVDELLNDADRAKAMGLRGAGHAARSRSWPSIAARIAEILDPGRPASN